MQTEILSSIDTFSMSAMRGFVGYVWQQLSILPGDATRRQQNADYLILSSRNSPRVLSYYLQINPKHMKSLIAQEQEISMAMGLPEGKTVRIRRHRGTIIRVEVPKPEELCFPIMDTQLPVRRNHAVVGSDLEGRTVFVDLTQPLQAHILIAGMTGSGKTFLQKTLMVSLAKSMTPEELGICILDVSKQGRWWKDIQMKAHVMHNVITNDNDAIKAVAWFAREMDRRAEKNMVPPDVPRLVLAVDEFADLTEGASGDILSQSLNKIAQIGREYGIHCVASTQHPTVGALGSSMTKRQFGVRFVGKVDDGSAAKVAAGVDDSGAQYLCGAGDFIQVKEDRICRFQAAITTPESVAMLPNREEGSDRIDLSEIEDPEYVIDSTKKLGRPEKPLDFTIIGQFLIHLTEKGMPQSMVTAGSWIEPRIGADRAKKHLSASKVALDEIESRGYKIVKVAAERN